MPRMQHSPISSSAPITTIDDPASALLRSCVTTPTSSPTTESMGEGFGMKTKSNGRGLLWAVYDSDSDDTVQAQSPTTGHELFSQDDSSHDDVIAFDASAPSASRSHKKTSNTKTISGMPSGAERSTSIGSAQIKDTFSRLSRRASKARAKPKVDATSTPTPNRSLRPRKRPTLDFDSDEASSTPTGKASGSVGVAGQEQPSSARSLRKRSIQQTHPYRFDKVQHDLSKSTGKAAQLEEVESVVQDEIQSSSSPVEQPKMKQTASRKTKKARPAHRKSKIEERVDDTSLVAKSLLPQVILSKTTLQIWLDGFHAGASPVTLVDVRDVDHLIEIFNTHWSWKFEGGKFSYAIASFPWLNNNSNILIRTGMHESFQKLIQEVEAAPVWAEAGDKARCEVKVVVFVQR